MEKTINVKNMLGDKFSCQDAVVLRYHILKNKGEDVTLDFAGLGNVPTTFFYNLFSELLYSNDRNYISDHIKVKNLANMNDYNRVIKGTTVSS
ncbi:STAS-like domain-containing protein [Clostridium felsineum]|uniref:STAS-like domain-containing protein n=1 Tax=Clostridium felsineum TaxID=36839 RepID=UPI00214DBF41|nr:STAS-like domain-containing protein [Clostridium felsineum]MCR3761549.1 STAS-like domain-containing protein [Clostridium felsineum]